MLYAMNMFFFMLTHLCMWFTALSKPRDLLFKHTHTRRVRVCEGCSDQTVEVESCAAAF